MQTPISQAAWRLLSYRLRTREELRRRLLQKGYTQITVEEELARLAHLGYLSDAVFARALVAERQAGGSARGSLALRSELRRRGVARDVAEAALQPEEDASAAAAAAAKKARSLTALPQTTFRRRLGAFLQRRGFGAETVRSAVDSAWRATGRAPDEDAGCG